MDLARLIKGCIEAKKYNQEFALLGDEHGWTAEIGNTCTLIRLGESVGEFSGEGITPETAVADLLRNILAAEQLPPEQFPRPVLP